MSILDWFRKKTTWHKIFPSADAAKKQIPLNTAETIEVNGKRICVAHSSQGIFAVNNKCPHNGFSLGQGFCTDDNTIVCPLHRYRFDLRTGRSVNAAGYYLDTFPLEAREDGLYIGLK